MTWRTLIDWDWNATVVGLIVAAGVAGLLFAVGRRRAAGIVMILALGFLGGLLVFPQDDDRSIAWKRQHLSVVQVQLAELADRLRSYKARHGRYPTNDEGLSVLDDFEVRFAVPICQNAYLLPSVSGVHWGSAWEGSSKAASLLRSIVRKPLADQQEMALLLGIMADAPGMEIAVGKRQTVLLFRDGLACSPWGIPYVYENDVGRVSAVLSRSPARYDSRGLYSIRVDEGVYVWSIGGRLMAVELSSMEWQRLIPRLFGGILITVAFVIVLWWTVKRYRGFRILGWCAFLISVPIGAFGQVVSFTTCYVMAPLFYRRDPQTLVVQQQLLARYRNAGIITDETYQRAINAANPPPPGVPASAPPATSQATTQATQPAEGR
jgi:hypothetical protein